MTATNVRHIDEDRFEIHVRGHRLVVDQPADDEGHDAGPTPTELFVARLASCVAFYARRHLERHQASGCHQSLRLPPDVTVQLA